MRSSGTDRRPRARRLGAAIALLTLLLPTARVVADETRESTQNDAQNSVQNNVQNNRDLEARAEATLGANLYFIDDPYDDNHLGGYLDQYRHTRDKADALPFFVDVMHLDYGLAREDETYLFRVESFSPNALNEHAELGVDWSGIGFDLDYWRFRTEELRFFPQGTYQDQVPDVTFVQTFGTQYTPDATLAEVRNSNRRFWVRRTGIDGELRFRPEAAGFSLPVLSEISIATAFEERKGWRQDSFVLDSSEFSTGADQDFRGNRRRLDQEVHNVGGGFVLNPTESVTADFKIDFETFREHARVVTSADIFPIDPAPTMLTFNYVPDTDRLTASTRIGSKLGKLDLHAAGFVTHLAQENRAPLRRRIGKNEVTTWSLQSGFDMPLADQFAMAGYVKVAQRRNDMDPRNIEPDGFDPLLNQVAPLLRRRTEIDGEFELSMRPRAGALLATGYRFDWIKRNLRYGTGFGIIEPSTALVEKDANRHTLFLRGRTRLLRSIQLAGELGWDYQPEVSFPRDPRHRLYFDGRGSYALPQPVPMTFSLFGRVSDAHGSGIVIDGTSSAVRKDLNRLEWNYGATATAHPNAKTTLSTTFTQSHDDQDLPYARTQFPRTFGAVTIFEEPRRTHWQSDVKSLVASGTHQLNEQLEVSSFANVSWIQANFPSSSDLSNVLENVNEIRSRLLGVGANLAWSAAEGLDFGLGYRFDQYLDREDKDPISRDDERHTVTLSATVDLGFFTDSGN